MRKPHGYATIVDPDRGVQEFDTRWCGHCTRHDHIMPGHDPADLGGLCNGCGHYICPACTKEAYQLGYCVSWKERLERSFARADALRSYGLD